MATAVSEPPTLMGSGVPTSQQAATTKAAKQQQQQMFLKTQVDKLREGTKFDSLWKDYTSLGSTMNANDGEYFKERGTQLWKELFPGSNVPSGLSRSGAVDHSKVDATTKATADSIYERAAASKGLVRAADRSTRGLLRKYLERQADLKLKDMSRFVSRPNTDVSGTRAVSFPEPPTKPTSTVEPSRVSSTPQNSSPTVDGTSNLTVPMSRPDSTQVGGTSAERKKAEYKRRLGQDQVDKTTANTTEPTTAPPTVKQIKRIAEVEPSAIKSAAPTTDISSTVPASSVQSSEDEVPVDPRFIDVETTAKNARRRGVGLAKLQNTGAEERTRPGQSSVLDTARSTAPGTAVNSTVPDTNASSVPGTATGVRPKPNKAQRKKAFEDAQRAREAATNPGTSLTTTRDSSGPVSTMGTDTMPPTLSKRQQKRARRAAEAASQTNPERSLVRTQDSAADSTAQSTAMTPYRSSPNLQVSRADPEATMDTLMNGGTRGMDRGGQLTAMAPYGDNPMFGAFQQLMNTMSGDDPIQAIEFENTNAGYRGHCVEKRGNNGTVVRMTSMTLAGDGLLPDVFSQSPIFGMMSSMMQPSAFGWQSGNAPDSTYDPRITEIE